jgi:4-hydroxy-tetrahydrodipicolinate reductase
MIKVCMIGLGKTGLEIARYLTTNDKLDLVMAVASPGSSKLGKDLGELLNMRDTGIKVTGGDSLADNLKLFKPDVAVDFTDPEISVNNLEVLAKHKVNTVICTTGFTEIQIQRIKAITLANKAGTVIAPNITVGVNVLRFICEIVSGILSDYDAEIIESHHRYKKDSPSGTALKIADSILKGQELEDMKNLVVLDRNGMGMRQDKEIGIHVLFVSDHDKLEIVHESFNREIFAKGVERAINFIKGKKGVYDMDDVLDLKSALERYVIHQEEAN